MEHGVAVGVVGPRFAGAAGEDAVVGVVGVAGERGGGGGGLTCARLAQAVAEAVVGQTVDDFIALVVAPAEHAPGSIVAVAAGLGSGAACRGVADLHAVAAGVKLVADCELLVHWFRESMLFFS